MGEAQTRSRGKSKVGPRCSSDGFLFVGAVVVLDRRFAPPALVCSVLSLARELASLLLGRLLPQDSVRVSWVEGGGW